MELGWGCSALPAPGKSSRQRRAGSPRAARGVVPIGKSSVRGVVRLASSLAFWVSRRGSCWMGFSLVSNLQAFGGEKKTPKNPKSFRYITYALGKEDMGKHFQILNCLDSEL